MDHDSRLARGAGVLLLGGAVTNLIAGITHPDGSSSSFHQATNQMLSHAGRWNTSYWASAVLFTLMAWAAWTLVDAGVARSRVARAGARLSVFAGIFMAVQSAVALAAVGEAGAYASGGSAPLVHLIEPMQAIGWPVWGLGLALLAVGIGRQVAPAVVVGLAVAGYAAMGIGGIVVEGFHNTGPHQLFEAGALTVLWAAWAGVRLVAGRAAETATGAVVAPVRQAVA